MNKKAVSEMVAYVMLIVIAVALSILVYAFLKGYILKPEKSCPDNVAIGIDDYFCVSGAGYKIINITIRNTGNFNIDGYIIRISNVSEKLPTITLDDKAFASSKEIRYTSKALGVGNATNFARDYTNYGEIKSMEIEPYRLQDMEIVLCKNAVINQKIDDCN